MLDRNPRRARPLCFLLLFLASASGAVVTLPARAAAPADKLPTQDEIYQLFDQGQQVQVLQKIARGLALNEALRAYFVEGLSSKEAADRFGYSPGSFRGLVTHTARL